MRSRDYAVWLILLLPCMASGQQQPAVPLASIQGTIVDAVSGAPLADAEVRLGRVGQPSRQFRTDARGAFVITDLDPGRYSMLARRAGYLEQAYGASPESQFRNYSIEFAIAAGQTLQASIQMLREATISGRISDVNRAPVVNARLSLGVLQRRPTGPAILQSPQNISDPNTFAVLTNDRGEYRMTGIPPGEYYVSAVPSANVNGSLQRNNSARTFYPGFRNPEQAIPVKVAASADISAIDFSLEPVSTLKVSGRITNSLFNGGQEGRDFGYTYILSPRDARITDATGPANTALPDQASASDEFEFWNVAPGSYILYIAYRAGPQDPRGADIYYMGRLPLDVADRDVAGLTVTIEPGVDIKGQLVLDDSAKTLVPNVQTLSVVFQTMNSMPQRYSPALGRGNVVQADGSFVLPRTAAGEYFLVTVLNPNLNLYVSSARFGTRDITNQTFEVDSDSSGTLVIEISGTAGRIEGAVTDRDNRPAVRARVVLVPSLTVVDLTAYKNVFTDANGRFALAGIRPGAYTAYAFAEILEGGWFDPQFMSSYAGSGVAIDVSRASQIRRDLKLITSR